MIKTEQSHIPFFANTHPGMSGKNNEDSFAVTAYQLEDEHKTPALLAVLSDGIGGHRAGEVASRIAVDVISCEVTESDGSNPPQTLVSAIKKANNQIFTQAEGDEKKGMGATSSVALVIDNRLYTATIGDSRIYLVRNGRIHQLSKDHTWIQEALDSGLLEPDQVEGHPNAHVIRRYLGAPTAPAADMRIRLTGKETDAEAEANQGMILGAGDQVLLCSDGLTDLVKDEEILEALQNNPIETAIDSLIDLANQRGGHDNITIAVLGMPKDYTPVVAAPGRRWVVGCLVALILAVLAGGLVLGWMWKNGHLDQFLPPGLDIQPAPGDQTTLLTSTLLPALLPTLTLTKSTLLTAQSSLSSLDQTATAMASTTGESGGTAAPTLNQTQIAATGTTDPMAQASPDASSESAPAQPPTAASSQSAMTMTAQPAPGLTTPTKPTWPTWSKPTPKPLPTWNNPFSPP